MLRVNRPLLCIGIKLGRYDSTGLFTFTDLDSDSDPIPVVGSWDWNSYPNQCSVKNST